MLDLGVLDAGVPYVSPVVTQDIPGSAQSYADLIYNAVLNSNWRVLAAVCLIGIVALAKWLAPKIHDRLGLFLTSSRGAAIFVILGGVTGSLTTALFANAVITGRLIVNGFVVGFLAAGGWSTIKNLATNGGPVAPSAVPPTNPPVVTSGYAAVVPAPEEKKEEEPVMKTNPVVALLFLVLGFSLASCAGTNWKVYETNFVQCLEADGITQASPLGQQIWSILDQGGYSVSDIEQKLESTLAAAGGVAAEDAGECAVQSWFVQHPVTANAAATNSQAAARIFSAKHLSAHMKVTAAMSGHADGGAGAVK